MILPIYDDSNIYKKANEMGGIMMSGGSEPKVVFWTETLHESPQTAQQSRRLYSQLLKLFTHTNQHWLPLCGKLFTWIYFGKIPLDGTKISS